MRPVEDKIVENKKQLHLAGVIPLCGQQYKNRQLPWHPALLPLTEKMALIDLAIAQCAFAGCQTIWIVVDEYLLTHFKKRIGDWIYDPSTHGINAWSYEDRTKRISIHYIPENLDDKDRRDSVSFQVIRGMEMARKITGQISSYVIPDQYFVTFPYSVYSYRDVEKYRKQTRYKQNIIFESQGKSIKTGHYMPFVTTLEHMRKCRRWVWSNSTGVKDTSQPKEEWQFGTIPTKMLPTSEQYSARWFGPDKVYKAFYDSEDYKVLDLPWSHDVSSFDGYREYMKSDNSLIELPEYLFKSRTWNSMSFDDDEFEEEEDEK